MIYTPCIDDVYDRVKSGAALGARIWGLQDLSAGPTVVDEPPAWVGLLRRLRASIR
jgi:hypothetical protein